MRYSQNYLRNVIIIQDLLAYISRGGQLFIEERWRKCRFSIPLDLNAFWNEKLIVHLAETFILIAEISSPVLLKRIYWAKL